MSTHVILYDAEEGRDFNVVDMGDGRKALVVRVPKSHDVVQVILTGEQFAELRKKVNES